MDVVGGVGAAEFLDFGGGGLVLGGVGAADEVGGDEDLVAGGLGALHEGAFSCRGWGR